MTSTARRVTSHTDWSLKSGNKAASQEQVLESSRHSQCIAESTAGGSHHKSQEVEEAWQKITQVP